LVALKITGILNLENNYSPSKFVKFPISAGIVPESWLSVRSLWILNLENSYSQFNLIKFPIEAGIDPERPLDPQTSVVTLLEESQTTPFQPQQAVALEGDNPVDVDFINS
jgi:hypothetical protein